MKSKVKHDSAQALAVALAFPAAEDAESSAADADLLALTLQAHRQGDFE